MSTNNLVRLIASVLCAIIGTSACTAQPGSGDSRNAQARDFWAAHAAAGAEEADRPSSVDELADRSDVVVLGHIKSVGPGRDYTETGKAPNRTVNLVIASDESEPAGREFVLEIGATATASADTAPPSGRYVFYLTKWYIDANGTQVYNCTSPALCVFGGSPLGTPRAPEAADDVPSLPDTVGELYDDSTDGS